MTDLKVQRAKRLVSEIDNLTHQAENENGLQLMATLEKLEDRESRLDVIMNEVRNDSN